MNLQELLNFMDANTQKVINLDLLAAKLIELNSVLRDRGYLFHNTGTIGHL